MGGQTLREAGVHTETGVSIVALIGDEHAIAAPGADDILRRGLDGRSPSARRKGIERLTTKVRRR